jgi:hypothetical protein
MEVSASVGRYLEVASRLRHTGYAERENMEDDPIIIFFLLRFFLAL